MSLFFRFNFSVFLFCLCLSALFSFTGQECFAQAGAGLIAPSDPGVPVAAQADDTPAQAQQQQQGATPKDRLQAISDKLFNDGGWWGPGGYFSPIKLTLYILMFFVWVGCASWINADQERQGKENREMFNLIFFLMYGIGCTAIFFIPLFWLAFSMTVLVILVPSMTYVVIRNQTLPPSDQVLTREHLWYLFAARAGMKHGPRVSGEDSLPMEIEPIAKGVDPQQLQAWLILARNAPGFKLLRESIYDAIQSRATALRFDFTPEQTKIWHQIDGVWLELLPVPRRMGRSKEMDIYEEMQDSVKKLIGANHEDRRSKQGGKIKVVIGASKKKGKPRKFELDYISQGTATGEAAMFQLHAQAVPFKTLDEIGVRPEMQPKFLEQINGARGFLLVSAPPAHGLRSTMMVFSRSCDRFTKDVATVEDVNGASEAVENVTRGLYDSSKGEIPATPLADLLFRGIATIFVRDMSSPETLKIACTTLAEVDEEDSRLIITMLRAKDGVETLKRFLAVGVPPQQVAPHISSVFCQRLIRVLCEECKEAYEPEPKVLQQLRLNPSQVQQLFRKRTPLPNPNDEAKRGICLRCHGVGYFGRTALFEFLMVSDAVKALLLANAEPAAIRQQFNKEGQQTFLHEGIRLLLKGATSVEELSRVLKM